MNKLYQNPRNLDRYYELMESQGFVKDFELILKKKDGGLIFALVTAIAIKNKDGKLIEYRGIISDDTEKIKNELQVKQLDVELMVAQQELKELHQTGQFRSAKPAAWEGFHGIGNELTHPIGDIMNNLNILKNYLMVLEEYIRALEWLTNHIQDYDETIFLVNEIQKVENLKENRNIDYILEDSEHLFNASMKGFSRIFSLISRLKTL